MKIKKRKAMLIGLAATTLFSAQGCGPNIHGCVYGPPNRVEDNQLEDVYGPPVIDEQDNAESGVYGPPVIYEEDNQLEDVYGPPIDDIGPEENENERVYGPPTDYDEEENDSVSDNAVSANEAEVTPAINIEPPVYGPAEDYE